MEWNECATSVAFNLDCVQFWLHCASLHMEMTQDSQEKVR